MKTEEKVKPVIYEPAATQVASASIQRDLTYSFEISRVVEPKEFKNLWGLKVKGPADKMLIEVVDADSLSTCIGKIVQVFEADGL